MGTFLKLTLKEKIQNTPCTRKGAADLQAAASAADLQCDCRLCNCGCWREALVGGGCFRGFGCLGGTIGSGLGGLEGSHSSWELANLG